MRKKATVLLFPTASRGPVEAWLDAIRQRAATQSSSPTCPSPQDFSFCAMDSKWGIQCTHTPLLIGEEQIIALVDKVELPQNLADATYEIRLCSVNT